MSNTALDRVSEIENTNRQIEKRASEVIKAEITENSYKEAGFIFGEIDRAIKAWKDYIDPKVDAANKIHKEMTKMRKEIQDPLETIKSRVNEYLVKCDNYFEAKAAEEAKKAQEMMVKIQEDSLLDKASQFVEAGQDELADKTLELQITPPAFVAERVKSQEVSFRKNYVADVFDLKLLIDAVSQGKVPMMCLVPNMPFINNQARNLKFELEKLYPGIHVREIKTGVAR